MTCLRNVHKDYHPKKYASCDSCQSAGVGLVIFSLKSLSQVSQRRKRRAILGREGQFNQRRSVCVFVFVCVCVCVRARARVRVCVCAGGRSFRLCGFCCLSVHNALRWDTTHVKKMKTLPGENSGLSNLSIVELGAGRKTAFTLFTEC